MKRFATLMVPALLLACAEPRAQEAATDPEQEYREYWQRMDDLFRSDSSPLTEEALARFDSIARFPFAEAYRLTAHYTPVSDGEVLKVPTTTEAVRSMQVVGTLEFELEGAQHQLALYRDLSMGRGRMKAVAPYFLPFTDLSNGEGTYGGGRYMEISPEQLEGEVVVLDFNKAYNPYCVYNTRYSCPIPPASNHVEAAVLAGARMP